MKPKLIIFDFDGTLGDTRQNIIVTMQRTMQMVGLPVKSDEECASTIGLTLENSFKTMYPDVSAEVAKRCVDAYREIYNEDNGILTVNVVSAVELTDTQKASLKEKLDKRTGKNVQLCCKVDPDCIGGIRVDYLDRRIDGTIAGRLASMAKQLDNTSF